MSFVVAAPEQVRTAAQGLASIHSTLAEASVSIAAPTTGVVAAAQDEVSAGVAELFNSFGQEYQVLSTQAQAFHAQFVNLLSAGAAAYVSTDVANAQQTLANAASAPVPGIAGAIQWRGCRRERWRSRCFHLGTDRRAVGCSPAPWWRRHVAGVNPRRCRWWHRVSGLTSWRPRRQRTGESAAGWPWRHASGVAVG